MAPVGPVVTNSKPCQFCTPVVNNESSCTTVKGYLAQTAMATVQAESSTVLVEPLTRTALYSSVSSALNKLCPTVTQTTCMTACKTDSVIIKNIPYVETGGSAQGELVVKVDASSYYVTSLRDAMINSAVLTAQKSATGKNCYMQKYAVEQVRRRGPTAWFDRAGSFPRWLQEREHLYPMPEQMSMCNAVGFTGVQYYSQFWRLEPQPGSTDYIDASWNFQVGPGW